MVYLYQNAWITHETLSWPLSQVFPFIVAGICVLCKYPGRSLLSSDWGRKETKSCQKGHKTCLHTTTRLLKLLEDLYLYWYIYGDLPRSWIRSSQDKNKEDRLLERPDQTWQMKDLDTCELTSPVLHSQTAKWLASRSRPGHLPWSKNENRATISVIVLVCNL